MLEQRERVGTWGPEEANEIGRARIPRAFIVMRVLSCPQSNGYPLKQLKFNVGLEVCVTPSDLRFRNTLCSSVENRLVGSTGSWEGQ